jgi:23S rRNA pseudouridine2605 synthase
VKQRLQKILSQRGIASRREAEKLIAAGRVTVNSVVVTVLGTQADPDIDVVRLDGKPLPELRVSRVLMLNKPAGYVSTCRIGREIGVSVLELLPNDRRYFPIGRLDRESTGLLLLTDDGDLAFRLTHPRYKVPKVYEVDCENPLTRNVIRQLKDGVLLEDGQARAIEIIAAGRYACRVILGEGRKRQIRRMFASVGIKIARLHRTQIGNLMLSKLPPGQWRDLSDHEKELLLHPEPFNTKTKSHS